jgi:TetR/AcrR family transcriptional repressor of nem operon
MSDVATAIMDAAEQRMRVGGFNGFSFREVAADVGIKSSSVHYHFPTKERLAAAVVQRYTTAALAQVAGSAEEYPDPVTRWTRTFRSTLTDRSMCPCIVLGAAALDLPPEVSVEVRHFYKSCLDAMMRDGLSEDAASEILATITGAMVVANALHDVNAYDRATGDHGRERAALAA